MESGVGLQPEHIGVGQRFARRQLRVLQGPGHHPDGGLAGLIPTPDGILEIVSQLLFEGRVGWPFGR